MGRLNPTQRQTLGYWWNLVTDFAHGGFTVTETVAAANDIAKNLGGSVSFAENQAIGTLFGYARRMENAAAAFQNPDRSLGITEDMIAIPPYARDDAELRSYPNYHVKFYYNYIDQGGTERTDTKTAIIPLQLPGTIQGVHDAIQADAEAFAAKYGHQLLGAIAFQILAV